MIVLDENILDGQRLLLERSRLSPRQIGVDIGRKGLKDEEIIVLLRRQRNATFFTRDVGFYRPSLRHRSYCLVVTSVGQNEVATFIRRFLRHPDFDIQVKRMGRVVRVSHAGLARWELRSQNRDSEPLESAGINLPVAKPSRYLSIILVRCMRANLKCIPTFEA